MIGEDRYKKMIVNMYDLRKRGKLKKTDFVLISYLVVILDFENAVEVKQKKLVEYTKLTKSDVSEALKRLKEYMIIEKVDEEFNSGYRFKESQSNEAN